MREGEGEEEEVEMEVEEVTRQEGNT